MLTQLALKHYEALAERGAELSKDEQARLEILQQRLKRYAGNVLVDYYAIPQRHSIRKLVEELQKHEALKPAEVSVLMDLLPLLNRAVHGAKVEKEACNLALDMGKDILATLEKREGSPTILQLIERWKNRDGAEFLEVGVELSKSFVKTPAAFLDAMHANPTVLKEWLENIGTNTFTLFESQDSLDDELYTSYYEKLKSLMEKTAQEHAGSEYKKEATLILDTLHKVKIRHID